MRAFVLAGGLGTRLRQRFGDLPKVLAPVGGKPWIDRMLGWLAGQGVRHAVLCVGYGAEQIQRHVRDGSHFGMAVEWSREDQPLGTGGALANARAFVDGPALVMNGDTLADCDPWSLERSRWEHGALGALALFRADEARAVGRVECDAEGRVSRFAEKDEHHRGAAWVSGGIYALGPALWRRLPQGACSLERDVFPLLAHEGALRGVPCAASFVDIGTPESWDAADRLFAGA